MRILIVEDDPLLGDGLVKGLKLLGYAADWFRGGQEADHALAVVDYDAAILDLGLPGKDGLTWLAHWRQRGLSLPVLILTARDEVTDRVAGLDAGADDYLIKPIALDELAARLRAVTRRGAGKPEPVWTHGALEYHPASRQAYWQGRPVALTHREAALLELLLTNPGRVLSHEFIHGKFYDWSEDVEGNALAVHIHHLRQKIHPKIVRTLRGSGYALGSVEAIA